MWWIYDVIAVIAVLVCVYFSGRQGVFKGGICAVGCIIGLLAGASMSGSVADSLYKTTLRDGNINKLDKTVIDTDISSELGNALETMGYSVVVKKAKIDEILLSEKDESTDEQIYRYMNNINGKKIDDEENFYINLRECYASVMKKIIKDDVTLYAAETAGRNITDGKADFGSLAKMIKDSGRHEEASRMIADEFIADAYKNVIRLVVFVIMLAILLVIAVLMAKALAGSRSPLDESTVSHITGGLCGVVTGVAMVCIVSAFVGLYAVTGKNTEIFFDNSNIDETFLFRYAYGFLMKK